MEIINALVSQLNVDENQARGGAGLILGLAKKKLGGAEFGQLAEQLPEMDELLGAAPSADGLMGAVGNLAGGLGGKLGGLGGLASLVGGFEKLGLDGDMVGKFLPVVVGFFQNKGGDALGGLLSGLAD